MKRITSTLVAALGLAALAGCEQESAVPDEATAPVAEGDAGAVEGEAEVDVGNNMSGEVPTEGGGLTEI